MIRLVSRVAFVATLITASGAAAMAGASAATTTSTSVATTHSVTASAETSATRYWTKARMDAATALGAAAAKSAVESKVKPAVTIPNPVYFNGVPTVGALFFTTGVDDHFCTASVVNSRRGDIVLTAAHCVYDGSYATDVVYVPEWHEGVSPYGAWPVTSITVAPGWIADEDIDLDFAFLTVAPPSGQWTPIQSVTGGLTLGVDLPYNERIHVIGYNNTDDQPLLCDTTSSEFDPTQIQFYCNNYWDGTSGGPWIVNYNPQTGTGIVIGDIGGYEQGGDYPYLSYSDYYGWSILQLYNSVVYGTQSA
jgi:V8-like Glu-specific endopeptidase